MRRRLFLGRIAAIIGMGVAAPVAQAVTQRHIELQRSPLAGFQYHQGEIVWSLLAVGSPVNLVREADNLYDARAVRVEWQGRKIGYVPRVDNAAVSQLLDRGESLSATITALALSENPWERIEFAVYLTVG